MSLINNWKLNKKIAQRSIYNPKNTKINEYPDLPKVQAFIKNNMGIEFSAKKHFQHKQFNDNENQQISKYYNLKFNKKEQKFQTKLYFPKHRWGRIIPVDYLSLSVFHRPTRHAFCQNNYIDIDIINCSQEVFLNVCKNNKFMTPKLEQYCVNREQILNEVKEFHNCNRDIAKKIFISLSFGGSYENWIKDNDIVIERKMLFLEELEKEYLNIMTIIYDNNKIIVDDVEKANPLKFDKYTTLEGKEDSKKRNCMSLFYQTIERHIQEGMTKFLVEIKNFTLQDVVPCQDGIMILKELWYDGILTELEKVIKYKFDIRIQLKEKPFDEAIEISTVEMVDISIPEDKKEKDSDVVGVWSDKEAAEVLYKKYPYFVTCNKNLYVFDNETGLWTDNLNIIHKIINKFEEYLYLLKIKDELVVQTSTSYGNTAYKKKDLILELKTLNIDDNWLLKTEKSSLGKILFDNGYYNFQTEKFYDKFDSNIVFFGKIHHNFEPFTDDAMVYMDEVKQRFFYNQLGQETGDYLILNLARALAGDCVKKILFCLGETDTGKSILARCIKMAFGSYFGEFSAENLVYRASSAEEAQLMRWVLLLKDKRVIISNEIKTRDEKNKTLMLNGNFIKKLSSGGEDGITARKHNDVETPFTPCFMTIIMANDIPKIVPFDNAVNNRSKFISYKKTYVDKSVDELNEFELQKDDGVKDEIQTLRFQQVFIGIMIQAYIKFRENNKKETEPNDVHTSKAEWVGEENASDLVVQFENDYEITNNTVDYVKSNDIKQWIEHKNLGISMEKFSMQLKKHCALKKYENVLNKNKKISGKTLMVWLGIKEIKEECEEAEEVEG